MNKTLHLPGFRVLCFNTGHLSTLPLSAFQGQKVALCWIPTLLEPDAWIIEGHVARFKEEDTHFIGLAADEGILGHTWIRHPHEFSFPLIIDPLRRLQKALRLSPSLPFHRGETVFFSRDSRLTFRLIHDLNLRGLSTAVEIAGSEFCQNVKPSPKRRPEKFVPQSCLSSTHKV